ncbi:unnamed protein product [Cunninghamella echinulata]
MICYLFLFLLPLVICLPLQQQQQQQQQQPTELSTTNQMILYDDIQGYYENILDEIISTQSEDLLVRLSNAKNDMDQLTSLLQPQANALLSSSSSSSSFSSSSSNTLNPICLQRMPSMIAHQLHDIHSEMMSSVEPSLQSVFSRHFDFSKKELNNMTPEEFYSQLKALHQDLSYQLLSLFKHQPLEKELTQALIQCEQQQQVNNQLHDEKKKNLPDVWSFLRGWLNNGFSTTLASEKKQRKVKMMAELNNKMIKKDQLVIVVNGNNYHHYESSPYQDQNEQDDDDDSFITSGPTLLQSYMNLIYDSLTLEFDARLLDLYNTLRSDVFDEDSVM